MTKYNLPLTSVHGSQVDRDIKGYCTSYPKKAPKLACFVFTSKLSTSFLFWKIIYASYSKLSKELINSIKIKVGQAILELLIQKQHFDCFDL